MPREAKGYATVRRVAGALLGLGLLVAMVLACPLRMGYSNALGAISHSQPYTQMTACCQPCQKAVDSQAETSKNLMEVRHELVDIL